jgi:hypothetical protein
MAMWLVEISKQFIEEAEDNTDAVRQALDDLRYNVDNMHPLQRIIKGLTITARNLTQEEEEHLKKMMENEKV